MCGIGAIFGSLPKKKKVLKKSLKQIKHRGDYHYEIGEYSKCAIGCNRLAIQDEKNGKQPKSYKGIHAVINGEIFNYEELRKDLVSKGHKITSNSDTELIPILYYEYGPKFLRKIDTEMLCVIIYDSRNNSVFFSRDRIGVKPLYYAYDNKKNLYVSSEIKQLSHNKSIKNIEMVKPGCYYFNGKFVKYSKNKSSSKKLGNVLDEAVKKRVNTKLPIAVFMSGGVDSTLILALARKHHDNVKAYIVGTKNSSDYLAAIKYCKDNDILFRSIRPTKLSKKRVKTLGKVLETKSTNMFRHSSVALDVARIVRKDKIKIALCGEGADELFAGYNEFKKTKKINEHCKKLLNSLHSTQLQRVDRTSMNYTLEVRCPFLDNEVIDVALNIPSKEKVKKGITKYCLRKVAESFVGKEIAWRKKMPFSSGAGVPSGDGELKGNVLANYAKSIGISEQELVAHLYEENKYDKYNSPPVFTKDSID